MAVTPLAAFPATPMAMAAVASRPAAAKLAPAEAAVLEQDDQGVLALPIPPQAVQQPQEPRALTFDMFWAEAAEAIGDEAEESDGSPKDVSGSVPSAGALKQLRSEPQVWSMVSPFAAAVAVVSNAGDPLEVPLGVERVVGGEGRSDGQAASSSMAEIKLPQGMQTEGLPKAPAGELAFSAEFRMPVVKEGKTGQQQSSPATQPLEPTASVVKPPAFSKPSELGSAGVRQATVDGPLVDQTAADSSEPAGLAQRQASVEPRALEPAAAIAKAGTATDLSADSGGDEPATADSADITSPFESSVPANRGSGPIAKPTAPLTANPVQPPTSDAAPAGRIELQLRGENNSTANVSFADRGGQVQVTVRAPDPSVVHALRAELQQLSAGLENHGYQVKMSTPATAASHDVDAGSSDASGAMPDRHSGDQPEGQRDPRNRNGRGPKWYEEFE